MMAKRCIIGCLALLASVSFSQTGSKDGDRSSTLGKPDAIVDRAGGTHNASNIGLFFENRGKLYPRRLTQGPSGEFPIGTGRNYIYRINPFVGIPHNVIQGRYTTNEEWEAAAGYHNRALAKIAFSDNPASWPPDKGWPVKDGEGNDVFKSDQDSYCVYNDSNNTVSILGVQIAQTGYAYGVSFAENLLFFKFEISLIGTSTLDSLYFGLYCDIDVGDVSGGLPEYADDLLDFDRENGYLVFYDDGYSGEWAGGLTGRFGVAMLQTPFVGGQEVGVTDMHYNLYNYDMDLDDVQYTILSSDTSFLDPAYYDYYFHPGSNPGLHYDDPATIPVEGLDLVGNMSSGPYTLAPGDTLTFITVLVGGNNAQDMTDGLAMAQRVLNFNFEISKPPSTPHLSASAGDGRVTLYWDNSSESSRDNFSGEYDFEGYRLYKSVDKGVHWDQFDRNMDPSVGVDPVPLAQWDVKNDNGLDTGLEYSYTDTTVTNGFEYWYTITAFDRGDATVGSLESPRGNSVDAVNTVSVIPRSDAIGRSPVGAESIAHAGTGISNTLPSIQPVDNDTLAGREYKIEFTYLQRTDKGKLNTRVMAMVTDSSKVQPYSYGISFTSTTYFDLINLTLNETIREASRYVSGNSYGLSGLGMRIKIEDPDPAAAAEYLPKAGDFLSLRFAVFAVRSDGDTVLSASPFYLDKEYSTSDGVVFSFSEPDAIRNVSRIGGTDLLTMTFSVSDETVLQNKTYLVFVTGSGYDAGNVGFVSINVTDNALAAVASFDTLYSGDVFTFEGVEGEIGFDGPEPPSAGNEFSLTVEVPVQPNIRDAYVITLHGSSVDNARISSDLDRIKVVPNPYLVSSLYEPEFGELRYEPLRQIQFIHLPSRCTITIFTVAGDLVKTITHDSQNGQETWDLRAEGGRELVTGIYLYLVKSDSGEFLSKFAIIK
jgi:hypothetical protein